MPESIMQTQYPLFIGIFVIITIVIAVLSILVIVQNRKINYLEKPRYGFLGKPLAIVMVLALIGGSYGLIFYSNQQSQGIGSVSADRNVKLTISKSQQVNNNYLFKLVPTVDGKEWGGDGKFDVYWKITNGSVITEVELGLTKDNPGGITKSLKPGTYKIKATVFFQDRTYETETTLNL